VDINEFEIEIKRRFRSEWNLAHLSADDLLALWWVYSQLTEEDIEVAKRSLTKPKDGGVDAVLVSDTTSTVVLVQAKFRGTVSHLERESDFNHLTQWASHFAEPDAVFLAKTRGLSTVSRAHLERARDAYKRGHALEFQFVSTGRISPAASGRQPTNFRFFGGRQLFSVYEDYAAGVQPIPELDLPVASDQVETAEDAGVRLGIYLVRGSAIREVARSYPNRIFARNIRGFIGEKSPVNTAIVHTVKHEPHRFRYLNNGLTMVCDRSVASTEGTISKLRLFNPQVVNGQQTSRSIASTTEAESGQVEVIVKVVTINRETVDAEEYDRLVREIVEATNRQTSIPIADLRSNDASQVKLYRELLRLGYYYARKTASYGEYQLKAGGRPIVTRALLADAVAGAVEESLPHRLTKKQLYEDRYYDAIFDPTMAQRNLIAWYMWRAVVERSRLGKDPVREQSKWLVHFEMWDGLWPRMTGLSDRFIGCMRSAAPGSVFVDATRELVDACFDAVLGYYAALGPRPPDPVKHFKSKDLGPKVRKYLKSSDGAARAAKVDRRIRELLAVI
jgi:hypothetical protein